MDPQIVDYFDTLDDLGMKVVECLERISYQLDEGDEVYYETHTYSTPTADGRLHAAIVQVEESDPRTDHWPRYRITPGRAQLVKE